MRGEHAPDVDVWMMSGGHLARSSVFHDARTTSLCAYELVTESASVSLDLSCLVCRESHVRDAATFRGFDSDDPFQVLSRVTVMFFFFSPFRTPRG